MLDRDLFNGKALGSHGLQDGLIVIAELAIGRCCLDLDRYRQLLSRKFQDCGHIAERQGIELKLERMQHLAGLRLGGRRSLSRRRALRGECGVSCLDQ